jgi:hypothetical protein
MDIVFRQTVALSISNGRADSEHRDAILKIAETGIKCPILKIRRAMAEW